MSALNNLIGIKFGRLTVLKRAADSVSENGRKRVTWECVCECGNHVFVISDNLRSGRQVSCGCYQKETMKKIRTTHGMTDTKLYNVWSGIKNRCFNQNTKEYKWYGKRGITMCEEWKNDFLSFYTWAHSHGYIDSAERGQYTIDRINPDGNYCPDNCRIATQLEQMNNVRTNHLVTCNGETHTIAEWSRKTGISQGKIRNRLVRLGWSPERALQTV